MHKNTRHALGSMMLLAMSAPCFAQASPILSLNLGSTWVHGSDSTLWLGPQIVNTYVANKDYHAILNGAVFGGFQKSLSERLTGQLGLEVATTSDASMSGNVWEDANANFNNLTYHYKLSHTHVALKTKILADIHGVNLQPYVSAGVGIGMNRSHSYSSATLLAQELVPPPFGDRTSVAFSYTLGTGIQKSFTPHWSAGVGYEFADWGRNALLRAVGQAINSTNTGLSLAHLYNHSVFVHLTYLG